MKKSRVLGVSLQAVMGAIALAISHLGYVLDLGKAGEANAQPLPNPSPSASESPTPPPQAAALGFTQLTFNQGGPAGWNIDVKNTGLPGFSWYQSGFGGVPASTSPANFSVSNGVLTILNSVGVGWTLATAQHSANSQGYVGNAYGGGYYTEASISIDPSCVDNKTGSWPTFWGEPIEHLADTGIGTRPDQWPGQIAGFQDFVELDFMEFWNPATLAWAPYSQSPYYTFANINWFGKWNTLTQSCGNQNLCYVANEGYALGIPDYTVTTPPYGYTTVPAGTDWKRFNTYGALVVPSGLNKGAGYTQGYFNNAKSAGRNTWSTYDPAAPAPPTGNQVFSIADIQHYVMILGTSPDCPMPVQFVRIWQK